MLDCRDQIDLPHLQAALAIFDYSANTVARLFAHSNCDLQLTEKVLEFVFYSLETTRTLLHKHFGGHVKSNVIEVCLDTLENEGKLMREWSAPIFGRRTETIKYRSGWIEEAA